MPSLTCFIANTTTIDSLFLILSAVIARGGENVNFLTRMRTKCVLKYQKSMHCVPIVNFADLFGSTGEYIPLA